jgi:hypothetical protein
MEGNRGGTTAKAHQIYMEVTQGWSIPYHLGLGYKSKIMHDAIVF